MSATTSIFGVIFDLTGTPAINAALTIRPATSYPTGIVGGTVGPTDLLIFTNPAGFFTSGLVPGNYYLWIGQSGRARFTMPTTAGAYLLQDLLGGSGMANAGINYQYVGAQLQLLGTDGNWYVPSVNFVNGSPSLALSQASTSSTGTANYQTRGAMLEFAGSDGQFRAPFLQNNSLELAQPGAAPFANYRIQTGGNWQLYDVVNANWRTTFVNNGVLAFGPATT